MSGGNAVGALANVFHSVTGGHGGGGVLGAMVHAQNVQASVQGQMALSSHDHALHKDMVTHQTDQQIRLSQATTGHKIDLVGAQSASTVSQMRTAGDEHRTSMRVAHSLGAPVAAPAPPKTPRGPQTPQTPSTPSVSAPVVRTPVATQGSLFEASPSPAAASAPPKPKSLTRKTAQRPTNPSLSPQFSG